MPARLMILVLTVGVFIAIWSGDRRQTGKTSVPAASAQRVKRGSRTEQSASQRHARKHVATRTTPPLTPRPKPVSSRLPGPDSRRCSVPVIVLEPPPVVGGNMAGGLPLPGDITPGEYRVVRSDGQVQRLRLTADELHRRGFPKAKSSRPFYLLHDGRHRWYFVRVNRVVRLAAPMRQPRRVELPAKPQTPVAAVKPRRRRRTGVGQNPFQWFTHAVRKTRDSIWQLPATAGRLWWTGVKNGIRNWYPAMQPPRTAAKPDTRR